MTHPRALLAILLVVGFLAIGASPPTTLCYSNTRRLTNSGGSFDGVADVTTPEAVAAIAQAASLARFRSLTLRLDGEVVASKDWDGDGYASACELSRTAVDSPGLLFPWVRIGTSEIQLRLLGGQAGCFMPEHNTEQEGATWQFHAVGLCPLSLLRDQQAAWEAEAYQTFLEKAGRTRKTELATGRRKRTP